MAFTTPATATAGTVLTASFLNTNVRDNIAWLATDSPSCRAYNNANISISNGVLTVVTLNSERYDNAAVHSTASNTSRFTIPTGGAGKYVFLGNITYATNGTGVRAANALLNGATTITRNTTASAAAAIYGTELSFCTVYALSAADYVEMQAFQSSGGALNVESNPNATPEAGVLWFRT